MPLYDLKCPQCKSLTSLRGTVSLYDSIKQGKISCDRCNVPLEQYMGKPPNFALTPEHTYDGNYKVTTDKD